MKAAEYRPGNTPTQLTFCRGDIEQLIEHNQPRISVVAKIVAAGLSILSQGHY